MAMIPMVEMIEITKRFPGVVANDRVSFHVHAGEVHALLGENGAGKSTLMSVLTGLYHPDEGEIRLKGRRIVLQSPRDAVRYGIGMVHQHFKLVKPFTVTENIMLGLESLKQVYDRKRIEREIIDCSMLYGLKIDPAAKVWQLSVGEQQRVEIVKALFRRAEILILDEPTAVLTPQETGELYKTLRQMAENGKAVILISHKMNEVLENTDSITVLRNGRNVGTVKTALTDENELARMMVGRDIIHQVDKVSTRQEVEVLKLSGVSAMGDRGHLTLKNVSIDILQGEILGIAGVAGNGQKELAEVIAGIRPLIQGTVVINQTECTGSGCRRRIDCGVSYVPEDRMTTGLVPNLDAVENTVLKSYRRSKGLLMNWPRIRRETEELIARFDVKVASLTNPVKMMSGGNLQKLLLAREIESDPRLMVAVYPMRGLDIGATESIRRLLLAQRSAGKAILLISEELDELFGIADRIAVIHEGEIMGVVKPYETTIETVGLMMAGKRMDCHAN